MARGSIRNNAVSDPFAGWSNYPVNLADYDPITMSGPALNKQIHARSPYLFKDKSGVNVRVIDIWKDQDGYRCDRMTFDKAEPLKAVLSQSKSSRTRVILIHQTNSLSRLWITKELMLQILTRYQVVPEFLEVLFSFGADPDVADPHVAESGNSNAAIVDAPDGVQHTCYQFRYPEENHRNPDMPWSVRQTGVYHQRSNGVEDLWILLNPRAESVIQTQLEKLEDSPKSIALTKIVEDPHRLHVLIFESCVRNWRWYLRHVGAIFEEKNDPAFVFSLKDANPVVLSFEAVQALRNLHDEVIALSAHCNGDLHVLELLETLDPEVEQRHILQRYSNLLQGYNESLGVLRNRIQNVIDLTAYALNTKTQGRAAGILKPSLTLIDESVDDSATVKLITILSLFYLPGSFIGTVFGTNFFWYNSNSNRIRMGQDFWIYIVIWVGLTTVTVCAYAYLRWQKRQPSKNPWHALRHSKTAVSFEAPF